MYRVLVITSDVTCQPWKPRFSSRHETLFRTWYPSILVASTLAIGTFQCRPRQHGVYVFCLPTPDEDRNNPFTPNYW